ncbi:MAG TPA: hypothetical protein VMW84_03055 [Acidobacteriota bacterium]|nr:hypothetical protein [Acidobacteriota bacterium]
MKAKKFGVDIELVEDFTQAQFEKYQNVLIESTNEAKAAAVIERALVQAAIEAGILKGISKKLEEYTPRVIKWLTVTVRDFINEQTEVPLD